MAKSWKSLFIKAEDEEVREDAAPREIKREEKPSFSMPSNSTSTPTYVASSAAESAKTSDPVLMEILDVYEKGIKTINMPGYDFYEFYIAISAVGSMNEAVFKMAYQMAKTMDTTVTAPKLSKDAEFYISKIKEVHQQYAQQGRKKLDELNARINTDKQQLSAEVTAATSEISRLKEQLLKLEQQVSNSNKKLQLVDQQYRPEQEAVQEKLHANDQAIDISVSKLSAVKEGIQKYLTV